MAVEYCRSSSGALSFRSKVSMATTTLDTWLGLSGRNRQLRTVARKRPRPLGPDSTSRPSLKAVSEAVQRRPSYTSRRSTG